tara:strand:- start:536 stop:781 length:246 start_codon:yes stop_codon:yes gene_type:complete
MHRSGLSSKIKFGQLDRRTITAPRYSFIHHFGYTRKYGSNAISLPAKENIGKALVNSKALECLADEIGEIRADNITAKIRF